jgi:hypothetical protein
MRQHFDEFLFGFVYFLHGPARHKKQSPVGIFFFRNIRKYGITQPFLLFSKLPASHFSELSYGSRLSLRRQKVQNTEIKSNFNFQKLNGDFRYFKFSSPFVVHPAIEAILSQERPGVSSRIWFKLIKRQEPSVWSVFFQETQDFLRISTRFTRPVSNIIHDLRFEIKIVGFQSRSKWQSYCGISSEAERPPKWPASIRSIPPGLHFALLLLLLLGISHKPLVNWSVHRPFMIRHLIKHD